MAGTLAYDLRTWSVQKDWDQAKIFFELPNFTAIRNGTPKGQAVNSKKVLVGRSRFSVNVYPSGHTASEAGEIGLFLQNDSKHKVEVDFTGTVGKKSHTINDTKIDGGSCGYGWKNFMKVEDVETNQVFCMDIKLKKEEINGTNGEWVVNKNYISMKEVEEGVEKGMEKRMREHAEEVRGHVAEEVKQAEKRLKSEIGKVKAPATDFIPECLVCLESLEALKIVQCVQGHKICEPCSEKEDVVACPDCKLAFLGRDIGTEASVQFMTEGSSARRKENLIMEKMKIVAEELRSDVKNVEVKLRADILEEINNVEKNLKAEIVKLATPAAKFIPECPICLHQMVPPTKIVHCIKGHKLCETCSKKEAVKSCPSCKTAFMGRDFGMEAFIRELAGEK